MTEVLDRYHVGPADSRRPTAIKLRLDDGVELCVSVQEHDRGRVIYADPEFWKAWPDREDAESLLDSGLVAPYGSRVCYVRYTGEIPS